MHTSEILKKPYSRLVIPNGDAGFVAEIVEFPGCFAVGATASEALDGLEDVASDWIAAALAQGQKIPEPLDNAGYSGKLVIRMLKSLHQRAAFWAHREGVSLNQFIVTCIAERVGTQAVMQIHQMSLMASFASTTLDSTYNFPFSPQQLKIQSAMTSAEYFPISKECDYARN